MALIKCSECGKEFSDKANACPNCACPINEMKEKKKVIDRQKIKDYNELTNVEKSSIRLYMRSQGANSTSAIVLCALGGAFLVIGGFLGFWLLFFILGICLCIAGGVVYNNNEKKYYYEHPESIKLKQNVLKDNNNIFKKYLPFMIVGSIGISIGFGLSYESYGTNTIGVIILAIGIICYIIFFYNLITKIKK